MKHDHWRTLAQLPVQCMLTVLSSLWPGRISFVLSDVRASASQQLGDYEHWKKNGDIAYCFFHPYLSIPNVFG
jgi:hypothetical protein